MKKMFSIVLVLMIIVFSLAACGQGKSVSTNTAKPAATETPAVTETPAAAETPKVDESKVKGKITFATNRTDIVDTEYKKMVASFKAKYPEVTEVAIEGLADYEKTLKVRLASGEAPDVMLIPPSIINADFPKFFAPLDDLGLNDKIYFRDDKSFDGKLYGITDGINALGIVYNKKTFASAGITSVPKTLDEFFADCAKLKAKGIIPVSTNFKDKWPLQYWDTVSIVAAGDAQYKNNLVNTDTPFTMDGGMGKTYSVIKAIVDKGFADPDLSSTDWIQSIKDVGSGKAAMFYLANWAVPHIINIGGAKPEDAGFFPMPIDNSGKVTTVISPDWSYAASANSKNVETAKAFIKFMIEESGYDDFGGFIPVLKDKKPSLPQLNEFLASGVGLMEQKPATEDFTNIMNKGQIDVTNVLQEFIVSKNPQEVFDKYNKKWADAKKALGK